MRTINLLALMLSLLSFPIKASDVFIETEHQKGQGIMRVVGGECFVYSPAHVVSKSSEIWVSTRLQKDLPGELITTYLQDLALIKLNTTDSGACSESSWKDGGSRVNTILEVVKTGELHFRHKKGRQETLKINIVNKALHSTFEFKLDNPDKRLFKGMSGSLITVGDYPVGMLLSVKGDIGTALRVDTLTDISRSVINNYATENELIEMGHYDVVSKSAPSRNTIKEKTVGSAISLTKKIFTDRISEGIVKEYKVLAQGNTAYRIKSKKQSDSTHLKLSFLDPDKKRLKYTKISTGKNEEWGFGTSIKGEHYLVIDGTSGSGSYELELEVIATPEELLSESNVLAHADVARGMIAVGTSAKYKILVRGNTAYRIKSKKQSDSTHLKLSFLDPDKKRLKYTKISTGKNEEWGFGTSIKGEHYLVIDGTSGSGSYELELEVIATPEELLSESNVLAHADVARGKIAVGTFAKYKILSRGNTAYRIKSKKQSDSTHLKLSFLDPNEKRLKYTKIATGKNEEWGFGTTIKGEHYLIIDGTSGSGSYELELDVIATPEELLSESNVLAHSDVARGMIAVGTFAKYKILSKGNTAYRIKSKKQSDSTHVKLSLFDSNNKRLKYTKIATGKNEEWDFVTSSKGVHYLVIDGNSGSGSYELELEEL